MKTLRTIPLLIALIVLSVTQNTVANDDKFVVVMQKNIEAVYKAETIEDLQASVNAFERIGEAEKTKWEPQYYAAFGYLMMTTRTSDGPKKDAWIDLAMKAIAKAKTLAPGESEVFALEGFAYMMRLTVDPASRGAQYSGMSMESYNKALALNPENPRALALLAQMQYGTAQFFGSSTAEACTTANTAIGKFEIYKSENPLSPAWGKGMAEEMRNNCQ